MRRCELKSSQNAALILQQSHYELTLPNRQLSNLGGNMKKVVSLLVMAIVVIGLSGCVDDQDGSGGKLPAGKTMSNVSF